MTGHRTVLRRRCCSAIPRSLLSLWLGLWLVHAPVPVLHEHEGGPEVNTQDESLRRHLARFHPADDEHTWFDWHIHWVQTSDLADDALPDGESRELPCDPDMVMPVSPSAPLSHVIAYCSHLGDLAQPDASCQPASRGHEGVRCHRHFLATYPVSLSRQALLGVALC